VPSPSLEWQAILSALERSLFGLSALFEKTGAPASKKKALPTKKTQDSKRCLKKGKGD
jgi:hypothetical protein